MTTDIDTPAKDSATTKAGWHAYVLTGALWFAGLVAFSVAFVWLMNPYGNLPRITPLPHVITDINQRYQYPAVVRSGEFDSAVFGTSSSRLLNPERLEAAFGGRFANLAMNDSRAWEQTQLATLFLKHTPNPRTIVFALDWVWCTRKADVERITRRGFPEWMYDDSAWNDVPYMLNGKSVEIAGRQVAARLGLNEPRLPFNGYKVFVPPEEEYDPEKVRLNIWGNREPRLPDPKPPHQPTEQELASWRFPALYWLSDLAELTRRAGAYPIITFMPPHAATLAPPGSPREARINRCKTIAREIAERNGGTFADFWVRSEVTENDNNYWDPLHYRVPIADWIVDELAQAAANRT